MTSPAPQPTLDLEHEPPAPTTFRRASAVVPRRAGLTRAQWTWGGAVLTAAFLEVAPRIGLVDSYSLVPLSQMVGRAASLLTDPSFLADALAPSLVAIGASFALAGVLGTLIGLVTWALPPVRHAVDPWLATYYAIPTFALYPLLVVVLGVGLTPIILLGTIFAIVAMISATIEGLDAIPKTTRRLMTSLRMTHVQRVRLVLIPAALPQISVGLRLALSYSIIMVLASEFVLATRGLGYFISTNYHDFQITNMYAGVLVVFTLALLLNLVFGRLLTRAVDKESA